MCLKLGFWHMYIIQSLINELSVQCCGTFVFGVVPCCLALVFRICGCWLVGPISFSWINILIIWTDNITLCLRMLWNNATSLTLLKNMHNCRLYLLPCQIRLVFFWGWHPCHCSISLMRLDTSQCSYFHTKFSSTKEKCLSALTFIQNLVQRKKSVWSERFGLVVGVGCGFLIFYHLLRLSRAVSCIM